jgi:hypothetical protein
LIVVAPGDSVEVTFEHEIPVEGVMVPFCIETTVEEYTQPGRDGTRMCDIIEGHNPPHNTKITPE